MSPQDLSELQFNRFQPDLAFQIGENDIIKFAKTMNHPIYNDIISKFANIPNIKFEYPDTTEKQLEINDLAAKLFMANKQYLSIINDSVVYFVIVTGSNGKAKNGIIACSKGVFYKKLVLEFLPSSNIIGIEQDDKNIKLILNNASYAYLSPAPSKDFEPYMSELCNLFQTLYLNNNNNYDNTVYEQPQMQPQPQVQPQMQPQQSYEQPLNANTSEREKGSMHALSTTKGMRFGLFATYVSYDVYLKKDRVEFISRPKNSVKMPLVQYSDIAAIKVKKVFSWYHTFWAVISCWTIIFPLLFLHFGSNYKLEITLKSGAKVSVCGSNKDTVNNLANELNQRITKECGHSVLV